MHELPARRRQIQVPELPSVGSMLGRMKTWFQGNF
jgi:cell division protein FtsA